MRESTGSLIISTIFQLNIPWSTLANPNEQNSNDTNSLRVIAITSADTKTTLHPIGIESGMKRVSLTRQLNPGVRTRRLIYSYRSQHARPAVNLRWPEQYFTSPITFDSDDLFIEHPNSWKLARVQPHGVLSATPQRYRARSGI